MNTLFPIAAGAAILMLAVTGATNAAEFDAKDYHGASCTRCHDDSVYTREDRRVQSYASLEAQVARCDANLGTALFPDDLQSLTNFLNDSFYHFDK